MGRSLMTLALEASFSTLSTEFWTRLDQQNIVFERVKKLGHLGENGLFRKL